MYLLEVEKNQLREKHSHIYGHSKSIIMQTLFTDSPIRLTRIAESVNFLYFDNYNTELVKITQFFQNEFKSSSLPFYCYFDEVIHESHKPANKNFDEFAFSISELYGLIFCRIDHLHHCVVATANNKLRYYVNHCEHGRRIAK